MNLLTRMKSPTSSVGRIDEDGILKGSARNERSRNTTSRTGKNALEYSTQPGSRSAWRSTSVRCSAPAVLPAAAARRSRSATAERARACRRPSSTRRSNSHTRPVTAVSTNRSKAKFIVGSGIQGGAAEKRGQLSHGRKASLVAHLQDREEGLLRDLHAAYRLHPLLAGLLLLEELLLARDVAAVALREHVLALRLDGLARDDLRADGSLDRHVEHLPRDEAAHLRDHLAPAVLRHRPVHHDRERVDAVAVDEDVEL